MFLRCLLLVFLFFGVLQAGTVRLYDEAAETQNALLHIRRGMTKEDVLYIMGYPYEVHRVKSGKRCFEVWLYFYKKPSLTQKRILRRNLIPLIFYNNYLLGWGERDYQHFIGIAPGTARRASDDQIRYTNDRKEWPKNKHGYVPKKLQQQIEEPEDRESSQPAAQHPLNSTGPKDAQNQNKPSDNDADKEDLEPPGPENQFIHTDYSEEYIEGQKRYEENRRRQRQQDS